MNTDSTLVVILVSITVLHFVVGIGYLLYKLGRPSKSRTENKKQPDKD